MAHVVSVDQHPALGGIVEPRNQVADGCLPCAAGAHQRYQLTGTHLEGDVLQCPAATGGGLDVRLHRFGPAPRPKPLDLLQSLRAFTLVAEGDCLEGHRTLDRLQVLGVGNLGDVMGEIEDLEHPLEGDQRGGELHPGVGERRQGAVELGEEGGEHHDGAQGDHLPDHHEPSYPEHGGGAQGAHQAQGGEEPPSDQRPPHPQIAHLGGFAGELALLVAGAVEQLDQEGSANVEGLLQDRRHAGVVLHLLFGDPP